MRRGACVMKRGPSSNGKEEKGSKKEEEVVSSSRTKDPLGSFVLFKKKPAV
jgi:hypothetical protein